MASPGGLTAALPIPFPGILGVGQDFQELCVSPDLEKPSCILVWGFSSSKSPQRGLITLSGLGVTSAF